MFWKLKKIGWLIETRSSTQALLGTKLRRNWCRWRDEELELCESWWSGGGWRCLDLEEGRLFMSFLTSRTAQWYRAVYKWAVQEVSIDLTMVLERDLSSPAFIHHGFAVTEMSNHQRAHNGAKGVGRSTDHIWDHYIVLGSLPSPPSYNLTQLNWTTNQSDPTSTLRSITHQQLKNSKQLVINQFDVSHTRSTCDFFLLLWWWVESRRQVLLNVPSVSTIQTLWGWYRTKPFLHWLISIKPLESESSLSTMLGNQE